MVNISSKCSSDCVDIYCRWCRLLIVDSANPDRKSPVHSMSLLAATGLDAFSFVAYECKREPVEYLVKFMSQEMFDTNACQTLGNLLSLIQG